jgi:Family of unknown function (DUF6502)
MEANTTPNTLQAEQQVLLAALGQLLEPMARLCLTKGVSIQAIEETVRSAFVQVATEDCQGLNPSRLTSRISTMTGLTRREVTRIQSSQAPARPVTRSVATDVLTCWVTFPEYVNKKGMPITIPRIGEAPSFEALANSVTTDVHPKSVLAQMQHLGLIRLNSDNDTVSLVDAVFVPNNNWPQMVGFMGTNVGEHMHAAVDNLLGNGRQHFEQSLLADELSSESLEKAKSLITSQWRELMTNLGPQLQQLMDDDNASGRIQDQQLRIGMYSYMRPMPEALADNTPQGNIHEA